MNDRTAAHPATGEGHPQGLYVLFFTEMWERFCYYGMRALLALYVAMAFFNGNEKEAAASYGAFTALVYATGIFGGMIADKLLGYIRSIYLGGLFIAAGEFALLVPRKEAFYFGLALMIVGNGLFKPNISTVVGKLYPPGDPRRDRGFTIFYMGINLGALLAPIVCGYVIGLENVIPALEDGFYNDQNELRNFRYGFAIAGLGMLLGLVNLRFGQHRLAPHDQPPPGRESLVHTFVVAAGGLAAAFACYLLMSRDDVLQWLLVALFLGGIAYLLAMGAQHGTVQFQKLVVLIVLLVANVVFWALFEQAGNSFNFIAENLTDRKVAFNWTFPTTWYQSVNPFLIVVLAPLFVLLWKLLGRNDPSIPAKFGLGIIQVGLGFGILIAGIHMVPPGGLLPFYILMLTYLLHTMGELCLSPIGLSMVTKLAPPKAVGFVMGAWFLSISMGNFVSGLISAAAASDAPAATAPAQPDAEDPAAPDQGAPDGSAAPVPEAPTAPPVGPAADAPSSTPTADDDRLSSYADVFLKVMWATLAIGVILLLFSRMLTKWMHGVK